MANIIPNLATLAAAMLNNKAPEAAKELLVCRLVPGGTHSQNPIGVDRVSKVKDIFFRAKVLPSMGRKRS